MDIKTKEKIKLLVKRIDTVEKRIHKIIIECAKSNNETLGFWTQKQKELRWEYDILKTIFYKIISFTTANEYWWKLNQQITRVKGLKSLKSRRVNFAEYKKELLHKREIKNLVDKSYNVFINSVNVGYKNKMNMLNNIQHAIIRKNRIDKAGLSDTE
jgi:hypothetical protein